MYDYNFIGVFSKKIEATSYEQACKYLDQYTLSNQKVDYVLDSSTDKSLYEDEEQEWIEHSVGVFSLTKKVVHN